MQTVYPYLLIALSALMLIAARFFRDVEVDFAHWAGRAIPVGVIAGIVGAIVRGVHGVKTDAVVITVLMALAIVELERRLVDIDQFDGVLTGALIATAAALPLAIGRPRAAADELGVLLVIGAISGFFISMPATSRQKKLVWFPLSLLAGGGAGWLLFAVVRDEAIDARIVTIGALVAIPLVCVAAFLVRARSLQSELESEVEFGIVPRADIPDVVHPIRRLRMAGWKDVSARRRFVRLATVLAMRKHQQRAMSSEVARLYQLEILKLRMDLQEIDRIRHEIDKAHRERNEGDGEITGLEGDRSSTMTPKG